MFFPRIEIENVTCEIGRPTYIHNALLFPPSEKQYSLTAESDVARDEESLKSSITEMCLVTYMHLASSLFDQWLPELDCPSHRSVSSG